MIDLNINPNSPFWSNVDVRDADECWEWVSYRDRDGYGRVAGGERAHRLALGLVTRKFPEGLHALHSCDNPPCCNPRHLRWGSARDNSNDKIARNRQRSGSLSGERNPRSKLSVSDLETVVRRLKAGWSNKKIAAELPISHSMVSRIRKGLSWREEAQNLGWSAGKFTRPVNCPITGKSRV